MLEIASNLYLHFLDRELRTSVQCRANVLDVLQALLAAFVLVPGRLFCSYSHLWESHTFLGGEVAAIITAAIRSGLLVPASDYLTGAEFVASRQRLYAHDTNRYPFYFPKAGDPQALFEPAFKTSTGATTFLS